MTASKQSQDGTAEQFHPDDGHRRCPIHVEFYNRIKFWTINASAWLIKKEIYYDAR